MLCTLPVSSIAEPEVEPGLQFLSKVNYKQTRVVNAFAVGSIAEPGQANGTLLKAVSYLHSSLLRGSCVVDECLVIRYRAHNQELVLVFVSPTQRCFENVVCPRLAFFSDQS